MKMFEKDITLQDIIMEFLKDSQESISSIHRKLQDEGYKLHRLVVTGYLKALADVGLLKEIEIKPSKVYSLKSKGRKRELYEVVGMKVKKLVDSKSEQVRLAIYILQRLFHRPVFLEELKRCGLDSLENIEAKKVGGEERIQARKVFSNTAIKLPYNDPAFIVEENDDYERLYVDALRDIVLTLLNAKRFVSKGKQVTLE
ncbi:MAG TPA: hypothetical protein ENG74_02275 [Thermoplasmatales archaeon]|nr:hypothetical protein [Thermoplasmatales archaeon]